ncbi:LGFP repeat-containing protein, partial [Leucobacter albus]
MVSDPWPNENQYFMAMGYACPDTGPGGSAACDPAQGGFAKQVYRAAWQYKVYRAFPDSYRYKPFQTNTIQWHPNAGCGTSQVRIENWATAALYIYTPYRPNQAALNAGWGTGDACSSYGNRNFYNYYTQWFGNSAIVLDARFATLYNSLNGSLGVPTQNSVAIGGGIYQKLEKAVLYWHPQAGAFPVFGGVLSGYRARGEATGRLGFPTAPESAVSGVPYQDFQNGRIYWNGSSIAVVAGMWSHYRKGGGIDAFGLPKADEIAVGNSSAQEFGKGTVTWGPGVGTRDVRGGIRSAYLRFGGLSQVGYATTEEFYYAQGAIQQFSKLDIYWTPAGGALPVAGGIRSALNRNGGVQVLGFPLAA